MGARSGGSNSGGGSTGMDQDSSYKGSIKNVEDLKNIKDRKLYNEMKAAISRFYKEMGLEEKNVKLADMSKSVYGVQATNVVTGKSEGVYLNKKYFKNATAKQIADKISAEYKSGWSTKTNKPVAHVMTHELAHTVWNTTLKGPKYKGATKEIQKVYNAWKKDKNKGALGYGKYSQKNINEFWAETITKAIHGKADKYTKALKKIAKKYKL